MKGPITSLISIPTIFSTHGYPQTEVTPRLQPVVTRILTGDRGGIGFVSQSLTDDGLCTESGVAVCLTTHEPPKGEMDRQSRNEAEILFIVSTLERAIPPTNADPCHGIKCCTAPKQSEF